MANTQQQHNQRWLKDMGLPQQDLQLLAAQNIQTARDLLAQSAVDLVERLNIPLSQAQRILQAAAVQVAPPYVTVSMLPPTHTRPGGSSIVPFLLSQRLTHLTATTPTHAGPRAAQHPPHALSQNPHRPSSE